MISGGDYLLAGMQGCSFKTAFKAAFEAATVRSPRLRHPTLAEDPFADENADAELLNMGAVTPVHDDGHSHLSLSAPLMPACEE